MKRLLAALLIYIVALPAAAQDSPKPLSRVLIGLYDSRDESSDAWCRVGRRARARHRREARHSCGPSQNLRYAFEMLAFGFLGNLGHLKRIRR